MAFWRVGDRAAMVVRGRGKVFEVVFGAEWAVDSVESGKWPGSGDSCEPHLMKSLISYCGANGFRYI